MSIWVLLIAFVMLLGNLRGYKNLFKSNEKSKADLEASWQKLKVKGEQEQITVKTLVLIIGFLYTLLSVIFYVITAKTFVNAILVGYSILMIILVIGGFLNLIRYLGTEKLKDRTLLSRVLVIANTVFIGYFIYFYMVLFK